MCASSLNIFYGNEEQLRNYHKKFISWLNLESINLPILDLGCGSGIFMELVKSHGNEVVGIDCVEEAISICKKKGLNVIYDDVLNFLKQNNQTFSAIFCSHLIEHFAYSDANDLLELIAGSLTFGGRAIFVTPNPASLEVSEYFWLDPTHVRPYPLPLLNNMIIDSGLAHIRSGFKTAPGRPRRGIPRRILLKLVLGRYFGEIDSFVVAEKI